MSTRYRNYSLLINPSNYSLASAISTGSFSPLLHSRNPFICNHTCIFSPQQLPILYVWRELFPHPSKYRCYTTHHTPLSLTKPYQADEQHCQAIWGRSCHTWYHVFSHSDAPWHAGLFSNGDDPTLPFVQIPPDLREPESSFHRSTLCRCCVLAGCGLPRTAVHHSDRSWRPYRFFWVFTCLVAELGAGCSDVCILGNRWR